MTRFSRWAVPGNLIPAAPACPPAASASGHAGH